MGLEVLGTGRARLADGHEVEVTSYIAHTRWFGHREPMQVIAGDGHTPLIGTALLERCRLTIDLPLGVVKIEGEYPHVTPPAAS